MGIVFREDCRISVSVIGLAALPTGAPASVFSSGRAPLPASAVTPFNGL